MVVHRERTAYYKPDFLCFTEVAKDLGEPNGSDAWQGELISGKTTEAIGELARQVGTHVIVGKQEPLAPDETSNAVVLLGREGEMIGRY